MHFSVCLPYLGNENKLPETERLKLVGLLGQTILPRSIASVSLLSLHNNPSVFHHPHTFDLR
jgi:hypothetical protein